MKSTSSFIGLFAIAAGALLGAASGCELIVSPDRTLITAGGSGGEGGNTGGSTGGTTNPTTGGTGGTGGTCDVAQCPAPSGECMVAICNTDGTCGEENAPDGTEAATQTAGDCKKNVCANGAVTSENDDNDPLDDGNECTIDSCNAGDPVSDPAASGAMCTGAMGETVCDGAGTCVECVVNADCTDPNNTICDANNCVNAACQNGVKDDNETDVDCGGACNPCDTGQGCNEATDCFHGICGMDNTCTAPTCNDGVQNGGMFEGTDGETDVDCGGPCGATCGPMKGCDVDGDCVGDQCTGVGGTCVPNCQDQVANNVETDVDCGGGTCGGCAVGKKCDSDDANCVGTAFCDLMAIPDSVCAAKKANGDVCAGGNQCTSATCTDGVCCNMACGGTCQACDLAGTVGTCTPVPSGQDPDNECMGTQVCNGAGQCRKPNGDVCAAGTECLSDNCVDGVCCNSTCNGTCQACNVAGNVGTCSPVPANTDPANECPGTLNCNGTGACLLDLGVACGSGPACQSGACVDGVCCDTACGGTCQACNIAGSLGTCTPFTAGSDPDGECSGGNPECSGLSTCGKGPGGIACVIPASGPNDVCFGGAACSAGTLTCPPVASGDPCFPGAMGACSDGGGGFVDCPMGGVCP
ncbi:MAG: hypothetical protein R3B70_38275 [Polyangiaceae bacterium]